MSDNRVYKVQTPLQVGALTLDNRLIMAPVSTYRADDAGLVTEQVLAYYGDRTAQGGFGAVITEHGYVSPDGQARRGQLSFADDAVIEGLQTFTQRLKQKGIRAFAQLNHAGSAALQAVTGQGAKGPSAVVLPTKPVMGDGTIPAEMSVAEINDIVDAFAAAAVRAKRAGYDGVEIHGAHGYLLNQFLSPLTNRRSDAYGGTLAKRLRIFHDILEAVRSAVGSDYPLSVRLGACDYMPGGTTPEDGVYAARQLADWGADMLNISGGMCRYMRPGHTEVGYFGELSRAVKEAVAVPVILTGGVTTIAEADSLLNSGEADAIGIGRAVAKHPHWADEEWRQVRG